MCIIKTINQSIQYSLVYVEKGICLTVGVVKAEKGISLDKCYVESFASHSQNTCGCFVRQICILEYIVFLKQIIILIMAVEKKLYTIKFEKDFGFERRLK
jgi:hypothetical protein